MATRTPGFHFGEHTSLIRLVRFPIVQQPAPRRLCSGDRRRAFRYANSPKRPLEWLLGHSSKAWQKLGWKHSFDQLVRQMVKTDLSEMRCHGAHRNVQD